MTDGYWALLLAIVTNHTVEQSLAVIGSEFSRGRKPRSDAEMVHRDAAEMAALKRTHTYKHIAEMFGVSTSTVFKRVNGYGGVLDG